MGSHVHLVAGLICQLLVPFPLLQAVAKAHTGNISGALSDAAGVLSAGVPGSGLVLKPQCRVYSSVKLKNKAIKAKLAKLEKDYQDQIKHVSQSLGKLTAKPPSGDEPPTTMHDIGYLIRDLRPVLVEEGLTLEDIRPTLEAMDTVDKLLEALNHPKFYIEGPLVRNVFVDRLAPVLAPLLTQAQAAKGVLEIQPQEWKTLCLSDLLNGLTLQDIRPALANVGSTKELCDARADPESFLRALTTSTSEAARHFAIARLGARVLPLLKSENLTLGDIEDGIKQLDTDVEELRQAASDPAGFMRTLHSSEYYRSRHVLPELAGDGLRTIQLKCTDDGTIGGRRSCSRPLSLFLRIAGARQCLLY